MDPTRRFSTKAAKYARYRWDYPPAAIEAIMEAAGVGASSTVADVGSGTGILTRHWVDRVERVYAVEPNREMRQWAEDALAQHPAFCSVDGLAEATTLPDGAVDLIVVGQALHWFAPQATRREFRRILKPGGWLAVLGKHGTDPRLSEALRAICTEENGWDTSPATDPPREPLLAYYLGESPLSLSFPQTLQESWEEFMGALASDSHAPDEGTAAYARLERAARGVFEAFSRDGCLAYPYATEVRLGRLV